jgi:hypothetical protein
MLRALTELNVVDARTMVAIRTVTAISRPDVALVRLRHDFFWRSLPVIISFECRSCHAEFDSEVGTIGFTPDPLFSIPPSCPRCGPRENSLVLLTEEGQGQLTDAYLNS